jgi:PadR family transcriptional regulator PadR
LIRPLDRSCPFVWGRKVLSRQLFLDTRHGSLTPSHRQTMGTDQPLELLPGTLDLLILKTLTIRAEHGYGIASRLRAQSEDVLQVGESSLYPALQRLLLKGWVKAAWGASENNRRARYYTLTAAGRKQLTAEREDFDRLILAIHKVLNATS